MPHTVNEKWLDSKVQRSTRRSMKVFQMTNHRLETAAPSRNWRHQRTPTVCLWLARDLEAWGAMTSLLLKAHSSQWEICTTMLKATCGFMPPLTLSCERTSSAKRIAVLLDSLTNWRRRKKRWSQILRRRLHHHWMTKIRAAQRAMHHLKHRQTTHRVSLSKQKSLNRI